VVLLPLVALVVLLPLVALVVLLPLVALVVLLPLVCQSDHLHTDRVTAGDPAP
jgi:hypothetical protein